MKKILKLLACVSLFFNFQLSTFNSASAQEDCSIYVIESDSKLTLFAVDISSAKKDGLSAMAMESLFRTLLDEGVKGFREGQKLMETQNPKWSANFLKEKNPPYMGYVKGYQTEGEPVKNTAGQYEATVLIRVNTEFLIRQLKNFGVMSK